MPKPALTPRMISDFCRLRVAKVLNDEEREAIGQYLNGLVELMVFPPYRGRWIDFTEVSIAAGVELTKLQSARHDLQPIFDAVSRSVAMQKVAASNLGPKGNADGPICFVLSYRPAWRTYRSQEAGHGANFCSVGIWTDVDLAPRKLKMTDAEVAGRLGHYADNSKTGLDRILWNCAFSPHQDSDCLP